ncbi:MAG: hypothetical protein ACI4AD_01700 [Roseburia sp.]
MGRNLLFISRHPEIVQEFLDAMRGRDIEIDTAANGIQAAVKLKDKEYQVVITGLVLEGYNGEQLITYTNKKYPNTVCIIYTTTISAAQLHFFINKRDVFRVFLRPLDFTTVEFGETLEEAFEYYAIKKKDSEEGVMRRERLGECRKAVKELSWKVNRQQVLKRRTGQCMSRMLTFSMEEYAGRMQDTTKQEVLRREQEILGLCYGNDSQEAYAKADRGIEKVKEILGE